MLSGRQALASFEQAIARTRGDEGRLDATLRSAEAEVARLRTERVELLKELARVRLDLLPREAVTDALDHAETRALALIRDGAERRKASESEREAAYRAVEAAQATRHARAEALEDALKAYDEARAALEPTLRASDEWTAQEARIDAAERVADEAAKKADQATADLAEKRKPYEADPLFLYLWERKFGTADYRASFLARFLDRKVAALVHYPDARANFAMLQEIPARLAAHAARQKAAIAEEKSRLAEIEAQALQKAGAGKRQAAIETARQALLDAEKTLSAAHAALAALEKAAGAEDPAYEQAVAILAEADGREDLAELYREAAMTASPEDETIVRRIETLDGQIARADGEVRRIRETARDLAARRTQIEQARDDFRKEGYDQPYGGFANDGIIADVIGGILKGAMSRSVLRDILRDNYRRGAPPARGRRGRREEAGGIFPFPIPMPTGGWSGGDSDDSSGGSASSGSWVPPWLEGGSSGGSWLGGGDSGGSDAGGDDFTTGGSF